MPSREGRLGSSPRDFADPILELTRLLRKVAEMEHALLVQYTYAALSVKPDYESIGGYGSADATSLLRVAIDILTIASVGSGDDLEQAFAGYHCVCPIEHHAGSRRDRQSSRAEMPLVTLQLR